MTTSTSASGELRLALGDIRVRDNLGELDSEHVDNLAQSIALRGLLVPLIVRPVGYKLVAGYHRIAACRKLKLPDAPVVVREHEGSSVTARRRTSRASS
jgi:ParB/RepB/Spo0J family partition protein